MTAWTDEQIARLRTRRTEGASASEIAAELGFSRSAVLGKAHRLGLTRLASGRRKFPWEPR